MISPENRRKLTEMQVAAWIEVGRYESYYVVGSASQKPAALQELLDAIARNKKAIDRAIDKMPDV